MMLCKRTGIPSVCSYPKDYNCCFGGSRMKFTTYSNENGGEVEVHQGTEETQGTYQMVGRGGVDVRPGEYLVRSSNSNMYEVMGARDLDSYRVKGSESDSTVDSSTMEGEKFDPSKHSPAEVK